MSWELVSKHLCVHAYIELTEREHLEIRQHLQLLENNDIVLLGQALGLLRSKLKRMNTLPDDMIDVWLNRQDDVSKNSGPPTWESLCVALRKIGQNGIAETISDSVNLATTRSMYILLSNTR